MFDFLDLTIAKDLVYLNIALGITFSILSDTTFNTLFPMYLFELKFSKVKYQREFKVTERINLISFLIRLMSL